MIYFKILGFMLYLHKTGFILITWRVLRYFGVFSLPLVVQLLSSDQDISDDSKNYSRKGFEIYFLFPRLRWFYLKGILKWTKSPKCISESVFSEFTKTSCFFNTWEKWFKAAVKSRRLFKRRYTTVANCVTCTWKFTITHDFAWCFKWPKLIRSRRAFSKAAFLTLCLCPSCFCNWADCKSLVPTLHCLIIILISMLPWMCITEQNLAPPWCDLREES